MNATRRRPRSSTLGFLLVAVATITLGVMHLRTAGLPDWAQQRIAAMLQTPAFAVQIGHIRVPEFERLRLDEVALYRRGVIGPPALQSRQIHIQMNWGALFRGQSPVDQITLVDSVLLPEQLANGAPLPPSPEPADTDAAGFRLRIENAQLYDACVVELDARILLRPRDLVLRSMAATLARETHRGTVRGDLHLDLRAPTITGFLDFNLHPDIITRTLRQQGMTWTAGFLQCFTFPDSPPRITLDLSAVPVPNGACHVDGTFDFRNGTYMGVELLRGDGRFVADNSPTGDTVRVSPLLLVRPEGIVQCDFTYDVRRQQTDFSGFSSIHPKALAGLLELFTPEQMQCIDVDGPIQLRTAGRIDHNTGQHTDMQAEVTGATVRWRQLAAQRINAAYRRRGCTNTFSAVAGELYGGTFTAAARCLDPGGADSNAWFEIDMDIRNTDFHRVIAAFGQDNRQQYSGVLAGRLALQGRAGRPGSYEGRGSFAVRDGRIFMMPIFGGFTRIVARTIPGLDLLLTQSNARSDFTVHDEAVHMEKLLIEGDILSMAAKGCYRFDQQLAFDVELRLLKEHTLVGKLVRIPTYLLSKLFSFRLRGTHEQPEWAAVNFSENLLQRMGIKDNDEAPVPAQPPAAP